MYKYTSELRADELGIYRFCIYIQRVMDLPRFTDFYTLIAAAAHSAKAKPNHAFQAHGAARCTH
jgi:hypothetical protein